MAIREDIVASAANFLRDPSVASSSLDSKVAFLQAKNLTPEEVDAALARSGTPAAPVASYPVVYSAPPQSAGPQQPYYPQQYPPYSWQRPPPEVPRRDWRDWFIMATVVGGVGYGVLELTKRYIYPLVAPPTPERLETDKKAIDDQFERAFGLVEQLAKDTEALKAAEQQRTERLDKSLTELEKVMDELKVANKRREDDAQRIRDDVEKLKTSIPDALKAQKDIASDRLKEVSTELVSLKTLLSQRIGSSPAPATSSFQRPSPSPAAGASSTSFTSVVPTTTAAAAPATAEPATNGDSTAPKPAEPAAAPRSSFGIGNGSGMPASRAAIPSWQLAMSGKATETEVEAAK